MTVAALYLDSIKQRLLGYKTLAEKTFAQLNDAQLHWQPDGEPNSIYIIVKHMSGNMLSRFSDFLTSDGEKPWRERDAEFIDDQPQGGKAAMLEIWEKGWDCLMKTLNALQEEDLTKTIYIRTEPHSVLDALNRQLSHYPYHAGQIVYLGKIMKENNWESLSIPKGGSQQFNQEKASGK
ncbi:DUF1572 family protein [Chitinophaga cymbidii]|uniref:DUF1572 domain-containing protein n=1 Tax=Chitinophaga cymbidii TaxID=1096750 RepID=A0A512RQD0_9BACT|nr:DUF1572 family protein [Chitinophaga cymbidii]GEP97895.1 hypothetical protein CCY01nite_41550 [Chitinophaga cymbidii]